MMKMGNTCCCLQASSSAGLSCSRRPCAQAQARAAQHMQQQQDQRGRRPVSAIHQQRHQLLQLLQVLRAPAAPATSSCWPRALRNHSTALPALLHCCILLQLSQALLG